MRTATLSFHETDTVPAACAYPGCRSAVSPHHSPHLIEAPYIERVRREANEELLDLRKVAAAAVAEYDREGVIDADHELYVVIENLRTAFAATPVRG